MTAITKMQKNKMFIRYTIVFLFIVFILFTNKLNAQIYGHVSDVNTGKVLAGANIIIRELNTGQSTDQKGAFYFSGIAPGRYHLTISYLGYQTYTRIVKVEAGKNRMLQIALFPVVTEISTVCVTATRSDRNLSDIPSRVDVINTTDIKRSAGITADELLSMIPGIYSSRDYGLTYKSGNVSMRGLNRNVQTLILVDGVPYTLVDGGASGWNRINPETIERIEVLKGPDSYMYGSNAMGGVINIITKRPDRKLLGMAKVFGGSQGTFGGFATLGGKTGKKVRGFFWSADGFWRRSDGYLLKPDSMLMWYDVRAAFNEYNAGFKAGYQFNSVSYIEAAYTYAYDWRSTGVRYYETKGSFNNYYNHVARAKYHGAAGNVIIDANIFYKKENYYKQNEGVKKKTGAYTFSNTESPSEDYGAWLSAGIPLFDNNRLTVGMDAKRGTLESSDIYRTSTDTVYFAGSLDYAAAFAQYEIRLLKNKLKILGGIRYDYVRFYHGSFTIGSPSLTTSFLSPYQKQYDNRSWTALSPKIALKYNLSKNNDVYLAYSTGFRPATLSDLCKTGDVEKGFKIANTALIPEKIHSMEIGGSFKPWGSLLLVPTFFYSEGRDFQYFVATGDSMATTGESEKPVIMRRNINKAVIAGAELAVKYTFLRNFELYAAYTFNHTQIKDFSTDSVTPTDLSGKALIESPEHILFSGIYWNGRFINVSVNYKFRDKIWINDENTLRLPPRSQFDMKVSCPVNRHLSFALTVQNIFNIQFMDSKGLVGPGRFIIADVSYNF